MNDGMSGEQLNDLLSRFFSEEDAQDLLMLFFVQGEDDAYNLAGLVYVCELAGHY